MHDPEDLDRIGSRVSRSCTYDLDDLYRDLFDAPETRRGWRKTRHGRRGADRHTVDNLDRVGYKRSKRSRSSTVDRVRDLHDLYRVSDAPETRRGWRKTRHG